MARTRKRHRDVTSFTCAQKLKSLKEKSATYRVLYGAACSCDNPPDEYKVVQQLSWWRRREGGNTLRFESA